MGIHYRLPGGRLFLQYLVMGFFRKRRSAGRKDVVSHQHNTPEIRPEVANMAMDFQAGGGGVIVTAVLPAPLLTLVQLQSPFGVFLERDDNADSRFSVRVDKRLLYSLNQRKNRP